MTDDAVDANANANEEQADDEKHAGDDAEARNMPTMMRSMQATNMADDSEAHAADDTNTDVSMLGAKKTPAKARPAMKLKAKAKPAVDTAVGNAIKAKPMPKPQQTHGRIVVQLTPKAQPAGDAKHLQRVPKAAAACTQQADDVNMSADMADDPKVDAVDDVAGSCNEHADDVSKGASMADAAKVDGVDDKAKTCTKHAYDVSKGANMADDAKVDAIDDKAKACNKHHALNIMQLKPKPAPHKRKANVACIAGSLADDVEADAADDEAKACVEHADDVADDVGMAGNDMAKACVEQTDDVNKAVSTAKDGVARSSHNNPWLQEQIERLPLLDKAIGFMRHVCGMDQECVPASSHEAASDLTATNSTPHWDSWHHDEQDGASDLGGAQTQSGEKVPLCLDELVATAPLPYVWQDSMSHNTWMSTPWMPNGTRDLEGKPREDPRAHV